MNCLHHAAGRCGSCTELPVPYDTQLAAKRAHCEEQLSRWPDLDWLPMVRSRESGFRNKAKMVVGGTVHEPVFGILDGQGQGVDLHDCNLYPASLQACFPPLAAFVRRAAIQPYDVRCRRGELKYLLVTESDDGGLGLRFVLRTEEALGRIRKLLPTLLADLPALRVVSANLQPEHKAVLEGEREIPLTLEQHLKVRVNDLTLHLRPRGFFQTNTEVAAALYAQARAWVDQLQPETIWDLYCGIGGFARHVAGPGRAVTGIELSAEAVEGALRSQRDDSRVTAGPVDRNALVHFECADATAWALAQPAGPALAIVNPPRRGLGRQLVDWLERSSRTQWLIYSSCNAESLALDLAAMPSLRPRQVRILDMFPQTRHYEVIVLLERTDA